MFSNSQQSWALAAPAQDPGLSPSTPAVVHNHPQLQFQGITSPLLTSSGIWYMYLLVSKHLYISKQTILNKIILMTRIKVSSSYPIHKITMSPHFLHVWVPTHRLPQFMKQRFFLKFCTLRYSCSILSRSLKKHCRTHVCSYSVWTLIRCQLYCQVVKGYLRNDSNSATELGLMGRGVNYKVSALLQDPETEGQQTTRILFIPFLKLKGRGGGGGEEEKKSCRCL